MHQLWHTLEVISSPGQGGACILFPLAQLQVQGNPIRHISALLEPNDLLIMIESTYRRGQPALGRMPEAIASANWENNMLVVNFPVR